MRIDSNQGTQPLPEDRLNRNPASAQTSAWAAAEVSSGASRGVSSPLGEDQAQLSGVHVQIQALVAQALQLPETTQEKVQALQQAVGAGRYQPRADQVAGALFSNMVVKFAA